MTNQSECLGLAIELAPGEAGITRPVPRYVVATAWHSHGDTLIVQAKLTELMMSGTPAHRTIRAGRLSNMAVP